MLLFHEIMVLWYDFTKLWFYSAIPQDQDFIISYFHTE